VSRYTRATLQLARKATGAWLKASDFFFILCLSKADATCTPAYIINILFTSAVQILGPKTATIINRLNRWWRPGEVQVETISDPKNKASNRKHLIQYHYINLLSYTNIRYRDYIKYYHILLCQFVVRYILTVY